MKKRIRKKMDNRQLTNGRPEAAREMTEEEITARIKALTTAKKEPMATGVLAELTSLSFQGRTTAKGEEVTATRVTRAMRGQYDPRTPGVISLDTEIRRRYDNLRAIIRRHNEDMSEEITHYILKAAKEGDTARK